MFPRSQNGFIRKDELILFPRVIVAKTPPRNLLDSCADVHNFNKLILVTAANPVSIRISIQPTRGICKDLVDHNSRTNPYPV